jgi:hypothetical protein
MQSAGSVATDSLLKQSFVEDTFAVHVKNTGNVVGDKVSIAVPRKKFTEAFSSIIMFSSCSRHLR